MKPFSRLATLFTLLAFPLRCTRDIEQSGSGRLFAGPFANEPIKSVLLWLSGAAAVRVGWAKLLLAT